MIGFRHTDPRFPFLWEDASQPAGRWHAEGEGPVHYLCDTPDGAWAELLRHEEVTDPDDLLTIRRSLWAVELDNDPAHIPTLPTEILTGGPGTYPACQEEARRHRQQGITRVEAPSAALLPGAARGWRVDGGLQPGSPRDGKVIVLFGSRPDLVGWIATREGRPGEDLLPKVRHFSPSRKKKNTPR
ncbi:MAG: RES domain-containing protein [Deltaproteobacteria bacterium]|nr:RES domain-containing protein [Deltaproteobacteria bacterium]